MPDNIVQQLLRDSEYRRQQLTAPSPPKRTKREQVLGWIRVAIAVGVIGCLIWFGQQGRSGILFIIPCMAILFTFEYLDVATSSWSTRRKSICCLGLWIILSCVGWIEFHLSSSLLSILRQHDMTWIFASRLGLIVSFFVFMSPIWIAFYIYDRITKPKWKPHPVYGWRVYDGVVDPKNVQCPLP